MKPSAALAQSRDILRNAVARHRAANLRVSARPCEAKTGMTATLTCWSIRCPAPPSVRLGGLQEELQGLGVRVDLLTPGDLPAKFRERVLAEARSV